MIIKIKSCSEFDLSPFDLDEIWVDTDADGSPLRELGFLGGKIVHKFPGRGKYGTYGVFDVNRFSMDDSSTEDDVMEFERKWIDGL